MKNSIILFLVGIFLISCHSRSTVSSGKKNTKSKTIAKVEVNKNLNSSFDGKNSKKVNQLLQSADNYIGTPYKFGGMSGSGFDCSGFVLTAFQENDCQLPRRSEDQAKEGREINIDDVKPGDLLFFATSGNGKVSHVAIVHDISSDGEINFIHASTSKGVMISSLNEKYWNKAFLFARRVDF